jgi:hypothetical protein
MARGASGAGARTRYNRVSVLERNHLDSGGIVTLIQRFGSSLNLNVHLHMLVLDGVYANDRGKLRFQPLPAPAMSTQLLDVIVLRVLRCLEREGLLIRDPEQPWLDREARDALDALGAAVSGIPSGIRWLRSVHRRAAIAAVFRIHRMTFRKTGLAGARCRRRRTMQPPGSDLGSHDAGGYCERAPAKQHHQR